MNTSAYISSGVIEAYIMGIASDAEVQEIEQLAAQYPEIQAAINEQQIALEQFASAEAVMPAPNLKNKIWAAIESESNTQKEIPKIDIALSNNTTTKTGWNKYGKYAFAASLALLILSCVGNAVLIFSNISLFNHTIVIGKQKKYVETEKYNALAALDIAKQELRVLSLPKLKKIQLNGVGTHTAHSAMLYWDGATGDVYVDMHSMPAAPNGKAYQLWAIVDGKPVDAGMYNAKDGASLLQMKTFAKAEMFAVTIEQAGGSPTPTMEQMVVAGKTS